MQSQFEHHVSILSSASDTQRKESLSWLETALATKTLTWSAPSLLDKLLPLLQDANGAVRNKLIKTLRALSKERLEFLAEKILLHVCAGMTNININIRASALEILGWAIDACGVELVECRGGWFNTLKTYLVVLGWSTIGESSTGWSTNMALAGDTKNIVRALDTLTAFLRLGMIDAGSKAAEREPQADWWSSTLQIHAQPDPYRGLNLMGYDSEGDYSFTRDATHRREIFLSQFRSKFEAGILEIRKQAGEAGRAAAKTSSVVVETMTEADESKVLQDSWAQKMEARTRHIQDRIWTQGFAETCY